MKCAICLKEIENTENLNKLESISTAYHVICFKLLMEVDEILVDSEGKEI